MIEIHNSDVREAIKTFDDNSFDAIITDPPYEIGFLGNEWDRTGIAYDTELWKEALRVLKPGGHLLSFGASRTVHRVACAIEDAGFEIRDQFNWLYTYMSMNNGPNVSKMVDGSILYGSNDFDKKKEFVAWCKSTGVNSIEFKNILGHKDIPHFTRMDQPSVPSFAQWDIIKVLLPEPPQRIMDIIKHFEDARNRRGKGGTYKPVTELGKAYDGYKVKLKPAFEPAVVARKPLGYGQKVSDTIVNYGTGALDIQGNLINGRQATNILSDADYFNGKAPGFILQPKAPQSERVASSEGNKHPTVKPVALMEHLVSLYTPPNGGRVLDMFAGSGSTMVACDNLGVDGVGIEMSEEYCEIIQKRIPNAVLANVADNSQETHS